MAMVWLGVLIWKFSEAPAASLHHFAKVARQEVTGTNLDHEMCKKNASRDAHAFVGKWGLAWKVPFSYMDYGDGEKLPYLSPISFVRFLVEKAPELLVGGCPEMKTGRAHLEAFWREYKGTHPSHRLFHDEHSARMLSNTFAFALHGDEGRGLKRANTTVVMMESCIGVGTWSNMFHKRNLRECSECCVCEATTKKFRSVAGAVARDNPLSAFQTTNLKQNSFLTKFVLAVIPGKNPELVRQLLVHVTRDLHSLYHEGVMLPSGERYFVAITGLKGDLPWHIGVWGELTRCFQKQLAADTFMCHECLAGVTAYPFEDTSDEPSWAPTIFTRRPYAVPPTVCSIPFERDVPGRPDERIFRRDFFHNTKMGVLRDYVGSTIILLCKLKYWHEQGQSNSKEHLLDRAFASFNLYCRATGKTAGLRSFSPTFMNATTWTCYPWVNCKGSDCVLLLCWLHTVGTGFLNDPVQQSHLTLLQYVVATAKAARQMLRFTYTHGLWPSKRCGMSWFQSMSSFLAGYNALAFLCLHQYGFTGYAMKSKYHLLGHDKFDMKTRLENQETQTCLNVQLWACKGNEDVVGKISRLSRRVSTRSTSFRTLQLYLIKSKAVYRRFQKANPRARCPGGPCLKSASGKFT